MANELSNEDMAEIAYAMGPEWNGAFIVNDIKRVYAAGVAVGIERSAKVADEWTTWRTMDQGPDAAKIAAAIRALAE